MKKSILLFITSFLFYQISFSQVFFCEGFDNLTTGALSTDPTGVNPGQNGWNVLYYNTNTEAVVVPEKGKGKVLQIKPNTLAKSGDSISADINKGSIDKFWKNRTIGNNILHLKFEYYFEADFNRGLFASYQGLYDSQSFHFRLKHVFSEYLNEIECIFINNYYVHSSRVLHKTILNQWVNVELFVDYQNDYVYTYIPTINFVEYYKAKSSVEIPTNFLITHHQQIFTMQMGSAKYDNICVSAISSLPNYLKVDEFVATKFNIFPNPANNIVNIINNDNIQVKQVIVYDISGKQLNTKIYNKTQEIQLNVENLASGTYILHILTDKGIVAKQLIKK